MFCRNTKIKDMESAGRKIRMGSVQMCDLDSHRSAPRAEGGVPLAPCESAFPVASHVSGHIQEYTEMPVVVIKMEHDAEEAITTQEASAEYMCLPESMGADFSRIIKEEDGFIMKTEDEADEILVKQELDIGPMVLQPRAAPHLLSLSTQEDDFVVKKEDKADEAKVKQELDVGPTVLQPPSVPRAQAGPDLLPDTSSGDAGALRPLYIVFAPPTPTPRIEAKGCVRENSVIPPSAGTMLESKIPDDVFQRVTGEHTFNCSYKGDTSVSNRVGDRCRCCGRSPDECNRWRAAAGAFTGGQQHEYQRSKYATTKKQYLIYHTYSHLGEKLYKCEQCKYSTFILGQLETHMRIHSSGKSYDLCGYSVSQEGNLKNHMRSRTVKKPYKCEQCGYTTHLLGNLKRHVLTHTGEKPFKCDQCDYSSAQLGSIKIHMRIHTGEKPYKCEHCEYSASSQSTLKTHTRTHTGEKPYKCEHCEYTASRTGNLKLHMRTHTGEKPYKCELCEYRASAVGNFRKHMRIHADNKPKC